MDPNGPKSIGSPFGRPELIRLLRWWYQPGSSQWPFWGFQVTFSGVKSDLHLDYQKVTWKKLVVEYWKKPVCSLYWVANFRKKSPPFSTPKSPEVFCLVIVFFLGNAKIHQPGDSIRDLLIPWLEVTNNLWKGHFFTIPKRSQRIDRKFLGPWDPLKAPEVSSTTWRIIPLSK